MTGILRYRNQRPSVGCPGDVTGSVPQPARYAADVVVVVVVVAVVSMAVVVVLALVIVVFTAADVSPMFI